MALKTNIQGTASIYHGKAMKNGVLVLKNETNPGFESFSGELFKLLGHNYPKFFKMDGLSKLGYLTAEMLLKDEILTEKDKTGVFIANSSSSLDTDRKFHETMKNPANYFPSPSLFVYTLPNILMGEISIRHKITGENAFFILDNFEFGFVCEYVNLLFQLDKISTCIVGWVDVNGPEYESILFRVQNSNSPIDEGRLFNAENLKKEYDHGRNS